MKIDTFKKIATVSLITVAIAQVSFLLCLALAFLNNYEIEGLVLLLVEIFNGISVVLFFVGTFLLELSLIVLVANASFNWKKTILFNEVKRLLFFKKAKKCSLLKCILFGFCIGLSVIPIGLFILYVGVVITKVVAGLFVGTTWECMNFELPDTHCSPFDYIVSNYFLLYFFNGFYAGFSAILGVIGVVGGVVFFYFVRRQNKPN
jgi:hypothetical protein